MDEEEGYGVAAIRAVMDEVKRNRSSVIGLWRLDGRRELLEPVASQRLSCPDAQCSSLSIDPGLDALPVVRIHPVLLQRGEVAERRAVRSRRLNAVDLDGRPGKPDPQPGLLNEDAIDIECERRRRLPKRGIHVGKKLCRADVEEGRRGREQNRESEHADEATNG